MTPERWELILNRIGDLTRVAAVWGGERAKGEPAEVYERMLTNAVILMVQALADRDPTAREWDDIWRTTDKPATT
jgi:hypothetical protein